MMQGIRCPVQKAVRPAPGHHPPAPALSWRAPAMGALRPPRPL